MRFAKGNQIWLGRHHTEETRRKLSGTRRGKNNPMFGRRFTKEHRRKMSEAHIGKNNFWWGKHRPKETLRRMSEALTGHVAWNKGKPFSKEARRKMSKAGKNKHFSEETRRRISKGVAKAIQEGRFHPKTNSYGISGEFYSHKNKQTLHYRSLLELHWYQLLEQMSKVKHYHVESCRIPYFFKGIQKHYVPDLRVRYTDGTTELVEIKPSCLP